MTSQLGLFDPTTEHTAAIRPPGSADCRRAPAGSDVGLNRNEAFEAWAKVNSAIVSWLERRALALKDSGRQRYSIKKLFEEARWDTALREQFGELKLNNNWHSRVARLLMDRNGALRGFFALRRLEE